MILLEAFTDGGCHENVKKKKPKAAAAFVLVNKSEVIASKSRIIFPGTNNIAELSAVELLLDYLIEHNHTENSIQIYTDSQLVYYTYTKWINKWITQGWKKSNGRPVENKDLIERIYNKLPHFVDLNFHWIRGHSGNKFNEMAHNLCEIALKK